MNQTTLHVGQIFTNGSIASKRLDGSYIIHHTQIPNNWTIALYPHNDKHYHKFCPFVVGEQHIDFQIVRIGYTSHTIDAKAILENGHTKKQH